MGSIMRIAHSAALALVALVAAAPAAAYECYVIVDKNNDVVYQDVTPPIDLSSEGAGSRDGIRARGQQLITLDTQSCPAIDRGHLTGKGGPASVEEIVAGMRPAVPYGIGGRTAPRTVDNGIHLPAISVPRATGGGMSVGGPVSGMSVR
jgi:hypothetical protein